MKHFKARFFDGVNGEWLEKYTISVVIDILFPCVVLANRKVQISDCKIPSVKRLLIYIADNNDVFFYDTNLYVVKKINMNTLWKVLPKYDLDTKELEQEFVREAMI